MIAQSNVARLLEEHTTLELRGIDRLYLNAYQPRLQTPGSVVYFFKHHRQHRFASTTLMAPLTRGFVRGIEEFAFPFTLIRAVPLRLKCIQLIEWLCSPRMVNLSKSRPSFPLVEIG